MKKRAFSILLVLALLLAALAGCGQTGGPSPSESPEENEQLLAKGVYEVYNDADSLVGYLKVTKSRITAYDGRGNEEETLRYDYDEEDDLYTLDGELRLFGSDEFTVKKRKGTLTLTADGDKYTLEEIDEDMPGGKDAPNAPGGEDSDHIELPLGCYAGYDGDSLEGYLKVERRTITIYDYDGEVDAEVSYSYDRDGNCVLETDRGQTETRRFSYERGDYYMYSPGYDGVYMSFRLEPVSESEIPVYEGGSGGESAPAGGGTDNGVPDEGYEGRYYIGGNGSMDLYAYWPDETLYGPRTDDLVDEGFSANGVYYADGTYYGADGPDILMDFDALLASDDFLQELIAEALENTDGSYGAVDELLYDSIRDNIIRAKCLDQGEINIVGDFRGNKMTYSLEEDTILIGSRYWRCCDIFASDGEVEAYVRILFWMDGYNLAVMVVTGVAEDSSRSDSMYNLVDYIINSVELEM